MPIRIPRVGLDTGVAVPQTGGLVPESGATRVAAGAQVLAEGLADLGSTLLRAAKKRELLEDQVAVAQAVLDARSNLDDELRTAKSDQQNNPVTAFEGVNGKGGVQRELLQSWLKKLKTERQQALFHRAVAPHLFQHLKDLRELQDARLLDNAETTALKMTDRALQSAADLSKSDEQALEGLGGKKITNPETGEVMAADPGLQGFLKDLVSLGKKSKDVEQEYEKAYQRAVNLRADKLSYEQPEVFKAMVEAYRKREKGGDLNTQEQALAERADRLYRPLRGDKQVEFEKQAERRSQELLTQARTNEEYAVKVRERNRDQAASTELSTLYEEAAKPGASLPDLFNRLATLRKMDFEGLSFLKDTEVLTAQNHLMALADRSIKGVDKMDAVARFFDDYQNRQLRYSISDYTKAYRAGELAESTYKQLVGHYNTRQNLLRGENTSQYLESVRQEFGAIRAMFGATSITEVIQDSRKALYVEALKDWNNAVNRGETTAEQVTDIRRRLMDKYGALLQPLIRDELDQTKKLLNFGELTLEQAMKTPRYLRMNSRERAEVVSRYQRVQSLEAELEGADMAGKPGPKKGPSERR